jgi:hypothetical protein
MDLIGLLQDILAEEQGLLFQSRWTCQATLRALPPLAKTYIMRLLMVEGEVREGERRGRETLRSSTALP